MRVHNRWMIILAGTSLAAACGGSSSDGGVSIDELPDQFVEAYCQAINTCLGPLLAVFLPGEDCETTARASIEDELPGLKAAIDTGRVRYDGTRIDACFDELTLMGCDVFGRRMSETCQAAMDGTVPVGEDCSMDEECEGSAYCQFSTSCPGTCSTLEGAGSPCERDDQCADGLICSATTSRCVQPAEDGEACGGTAEPPCRPNLICMGDDEATGTAGTCQEVNAVFSAQDGDACNPVDGPLCEVGLHCILDNINALTGELVFVCGSGVESGGTCQPAFPDVCPTDEFCAVALPTTIEGTCTPKPEEGDLCAPSPFGDAANVCAPNTRCDGGTCRARQRLGGSCTSDEVCYSEQCTGGACTQSGVCD